MSNIPTEELKPLFDWIKTLNTTQKIFVFIGTCCAIFFIASGFGQYKADSSSSFLAWMACCVVGYYLFAPQESEE